LIFVKCSIHLFVTVNKFLLFYLAVTVKVEQVERLLQFSLLFLCCHVRYHKSDGRSLQLGFSLNKLAIITYPKFLQIFKRLCSQFFVEGCVHLTLDPRVIKRFLCTKSFLRIFFH
jgi:hypothetical protein